MHSKVLSQGQLHCATAGQVPQRPANFARRTPSPASRTLTLLKLRRISCTSTSQSRRWCASGDFDHKLQQLSEWKDSFGTCYVPPSASDAAQLHSWVRWARQAAKKDQLSDEQKQQLESLSFVWKPNVIDAKWHHNYHSLRCLLDSGSTTLQQLLQQQQQGAEGQEQQQQQQQQQHADTHELSIWLDRQVELYGKLKLTAVKVKLLRKLGVKLNRQAGLARDNLHPVLQGIDPETYQRRPITVEAATKQGKRAVGRLLQQYQHWQQQQQQREHAFEVQDADIAFMCMLAELQKWKKKYGSSIVPVGVFDKPELAQWVQQLRQARSAAADADNSNTTTSSSSSNSSNNRHQAVSSADSAADEQQQQQQEQQQQSPLLAAAAVPGQLQPWHVQELEAVGFCWNTQQVDVKWVEQYHRLRHFQQKHHHLSLPSAAAAAAGHSTNIAGSELHFSTPSESTSSSSDKWNGLSEWLQQQRELLGLTDWGVIQLPGTQAALGQQRPLTKLQRRLLKDLGVQRLSVVVTSR